MLYEEAKLGKISMKNRWVMLAMHMGYALESGEFSEQDFAFYEARSKGGAAAITIVGAIDEMGSADAMHRLDKPEVEPSFKKMCDMIHANDCKVIIQLFHSGRNNTVETLNGKTPIAPSVVPSPIYRTDPREMTEEEIEETIRHFAEAAARCKKCGADGVEISASAGYLLTQFMSPRTNLRTDKWGGSEENRLRFPIEVMKAVRAAVGEDFTVIAKVSGGDMMGGYENSLNVKLINSLPKGTLDGVTVTGGWHEAPVPQISYHVSPGGYSYLAREIKEGTGLPVIACNRINNPETAEKLLQAGDCDFAGAGRAFLADPGFAVKAENGIPYNKCQGCNRGCIERALKHLSCVCAFNPEAGYEYLSKRSEKPGTVLVIGGGPVGLSAAKLAAKAGHKAVLAEASDKLGGKIHIADKPPYKADLEAFTNTLAYDLEKLGVDIRLNTPASEELIAEVNPDCVIFAIGADTIIPKLEGLDEIKCMTADEVLAGAEVKADGDIIVMGGGTVGLETAEFLADKKIGKSITVIEMAPKAGKDLGGLKWIMMKSLKKLGVAVMTNTKAVKGNGRALETECLVPVSDEKPADGSKPELKTVEKTLPCDVLIYAVGSRARDTAGFGSLLDEKKIKYFTVGDAKKAGNIMQGLIDAREAVNAL